MTTTLSPAPTDEPGREPGTPSARTGSGPDQPGAPTDQPGAAPSITLPAEADANSGEPPGAWFLTAAERGNPDTRLDSRHRDGRAWTAGNHVTPLVDGATYFAELHRVLSAVGAGDLVLFTDWRGDPDERLLGDEGSEVGAVLARAARRGADVRGMLWRSHLAGFDAATEGHRQLGELIEEAGGQVLLDMRVRPFGSHHQKLIVVRHRDRPEDDVAFIGGIDLCHSRRDDHRHLGDPQVFPMAGVYGRTPAWHDVQVAVRGPAVGDAETVFRERWEDPSALAHHPVHALSQLLHRERRREQAHPLPAQRPDPPPCGDVAVQLLRTYPRRIPAYPFARAGERSIARGYSKVLARARSLVYLEDQYLWSPEVVEVFADALRQAPQLRMILVIPAYSEQDGRWSGPPNVIGRERPVRLLRDAGGDRVAIYGLENQVGRPIYVHAKACVVDDRWACVGSDNTNRRSWTHDSELGAAMVAAGPGSIAQELRHTLSREHLGAAAEGVDLDDPVVWFRAFADAAAELDDWHAGGCRGPRPPGQVRTYELASLPPVTRLWALGVHRRFYDPDGRGLRARRAGRL